MTLISAILRAETTRVAAIRLVVLASMLSFSLVATPALSAEPQLAAHTMAQRSVRRRLPLIPGVSGFGTTSFGGSGRHVVPPRTRIVRVTSLADSGPGTLRNCLTLREPRTCIFDVSGEIRLKTMLRITSPYITIAGQTAPTPGITITRGGIKIETHNVLIQHIAIRPGDSRFGPKAIDRDGISIGARAPRAAHNVVLDHVSLTWAIDENASTWSRTTRHVTITNSIIAEGLHNSVHPKGPHSKGLLIGNNSRRVTVAMNAIAFNDERNPYLKPGSSTEFVNNVVYGWGSRGGWALCNISDNDGEDTPLQLSFIGNIYKPGPDSVRAPPLYAKPLATRSHIFQSLNAWHDGQITAHSNDRVANFPVARLLATRPAGTVSGRSVLPPYEAFEVILRNVGSRPRERSSIDTRILNEIATGQGSIKDCIAGCRRAAGRPRRYESRRAVFKVPSDPMQQDVIGGYTALERLLHRKAREVELPR